LAVQVLEAVETTSWQEIAFDGGKRPLDPPFSIRMTNLASAPLATLEESAGQSATEHLRELIVATSCGRSHVSPKRTIYTYHTAP